MSPESTVWSETAKPPAAAKSNGGQQ
jgi:hypothetical protein